MMGLREVTSNSDATGTRTHPNFANFDYIRLVAAKLWLVIHAAEAGAQSSRDLRMVRDALAVVERVIRRIYNSLGRSALEFASSKPIILAPSPRGAFSLQTTCNSHGGARYSPPIRREDFPNLAPLRRDFPMARPECPHNLVALLGASLAEDAKGRSLSSGGFLRTSFFLVGFDDLGSTGGVGCSSTWRFESTSGLSTPAISSAEIANLSNVSTRRW